MSSAKKNKVILKSVFLIFDIFTYCFISYTILQNFALKGYYTFSLLEKMLIPQTEINLKSICFLKKTLEM
jgi:hypothetical protein